MTLTRSRRAWWSFRETRARRDSPAGLGLYRDDRVERSLAQASPGDLEAVTGVRVDGLRRQLIAGPRVRSSWSDRDPDHHERTLVAGDAAADPPSALGPLTATAAADPFVGVSADQCFRGGGTASYGKCVGGAYNGFDTYIPQ